MPESIRYQKHTFIDYEAHTAFDYTRLRDEGGDLEFRPLVSLLSCALSARKIQEDWEDKQRSGNTWHI